MTNSKPQLAQKKRKILGPTGRLLLKAFNWKIEGEIPNLKKMIPNAIIEIHMDIGEEERNKTRHLVENSKGWVSGSGFISKIKPYAWASSVADWHTK